MPNTWLPWLKNEFKQPYFLKLKSFLNNEYEQFTCFPPKTLVFQAFELTPPEKIKVVILGQDPYHQPGQANGLAFSVRPGVSLPMSLVNIFTELKDNYGCTISQNGDLTKWAQQGVFLLNTILTVRQHQALSHQDQGWETFTDRVLQYLNQLDQHIVYVLWGKKAQSKQSLLNNDRHRIITSSHPSPYSAYYGFFGSRVFAKINAFLVSYNLDPIVWDLSQ